MLLLLLLLLLPPLTGPGSLMVVGSIALRLFEPNFSLPLNEYWGVVLMVESATLPSRRVLRTYVPGPGLSPVLRRGGRVLDPNLVEGGTEEGREEEEGRR